jgi:hypothetical protein
LLPCRRRNLPLQVHEELRRHLSVLSEFHASLAVCCETLRPFAVRATVPMPGISGVDTPAGSRHLKAASLDVVSPVSMGDFGCVTALVGRTELEMLGVSISRIAVGVATTGGAIALDGLTWVDWNRHGNE